VLQEVLHITVAVQVLVDSDFFHKFVEIFASIFNELRVKSVWRDISSRASVQTGHVLTKDLDGRLGMARFGYLSVS